MLITLLTCDKKYSQVMKNGNCQKKIDTAITMMPIEQMKDFGWSYGE